MNSDSSTELLYDASKTHYYKNRKRTITLLYSSLFVVTGVAIAVCLRRILMEAETSTENLFFPILMFVILILLVIAMILNFMQRSIQFTNLKVFEDKIQFFIPPMIFCLKPKSINIKFDNIKSVCFESRLLRMVIELKKGGRIYLPESVAGDFTIIRNLFIKKTIPISREEQKRNGTNPNNPNPQ